MAKKSANSKGSKKKAVRKRNRKRKPIKIKVTAYVMSAVLILLLAVAGLIAKPYIKEKNEVYKGASVPSGYYCYGIDISRYQTDIEWEKIKVLTDAHGRTTNSVNQAKDIRNISYVFIKATEGNSFRDKYFKRHWKNAGKRGIRRGAYHFFRSSKDAGLQANHFIRTVGDLSANDLPPVLDIETIHKGCSYKTLNEKALIWLKAVEKHYGRKPVVYSSASFINDILCKEIKENYPIWVAHYGVSRPRCDKWHIWQFADNATVYGIAGEVDLNVTTKETLETL
ncbi:MAG: glycoside hydrolase family 25 protein [Bacteroidales bacterium]|nr:glycoside hydrolase family 25 protein [Bacteroidales bacterium]